LTLSTEVDRSDYTPYYIQVKNALLAHIESGGWRPGDQLPGEPELCRMFEVSRTVIRQALKEMEYEGYIRREKGKGTFVDKPKINQGLAQKLTGFYRDMVERGETPITKVLRQGLVPASSKVASLLQLEPDDQVIELQRLRGVGDEFFVLVTAYLPYTICPEVLHTDFSNQSLYAFLEEDLGLNITHGKRTLEAVLANDYEANLLQINKGDPLILLDSVVYLDDGRPIEYFHAVHRGGRARFEVDLIRVRK
jgi:GntR family transcriptional regulator